MVGLESSFADFGPKFLIPSDFVAVFGRKSAKLALGDFGTTVLY